MKILRYCAEFKQKGGEDKFLVFNCFVLHSTNFIRPLKFQESLLCCFQSYQKFLLKKFKPPTYCSNFIFKLRLILLSLQSSVSSRIQKIRNIKKDELKPHIFVNFYPQIFIEFFINDAAIRNQTLQIFFPVWFLKSTLILFCTLANSKHWNGLKNLLSKCCYILTLNKNLWQNFFFLLLSFLLSTHLWLFWQHC